MRFYKKISYFLSLGGISGRYDAYPPCYGNRWSLVPAPSIKYGQGSGNSDVSYHNSFHATLFLVMIDP